MSLFSRIFGRKRLADVSSTISPAEFRKRVKIVVVDDDESSFPYKLLQDDGYTIEWWENLTSQKLQRLENGDFDIIILDIRGIADQSLSASEGIGVLERIKSVNPHQTVVAFSGYSYDLSKTEFWRMADDALTKPVTVIHGKEILDRLIQEKITLVNYWNAVVLLLKADNMPESTIRKLEKDIVAAFTKELRMDPADICSNAFGAIRNSAAIITLTQAIMRLWG